MPMSGIRLSVRLTTSAANFARPCEQSSVCRTEATQADHCECLTIRFSRLRITVQDQPGTSGRLLSDLRYTLMDADVRRCVRLGMRLPRSICLRVKCRAGESPPWANETS